MSDSGTYITADSKQNDRDRRGRHTRRLEIVIEACCSASADGSHASASSESGHGHHNPHAAMNLHLGHQHDTTSKLLTSRLGTRPSVEGIGPVSSLFQATNTLRWDVASKLSCMEPVSLLASANRARAGVKHGRDAVQHLEMSNKNDKSQCPTIHSWP